MPSGKTHDRITFLAALPAGLGCHAYLGAWEPAVAVAGGVLFGGLMFGPDLDVKSVQYYRWGPLRWIWWPYQRMFRHRSPWTHGLAWGLVVRLLYLTLVTGAMAAIAFALVHTYVMPLSFSVDAHALFVAPDQLTARLLMAGLVGTWLGGALHTWADVVVSALKRRLGGRRRGR